MGLSRADMPGTVEFDAEMLVGKAIPASSLARLGKSAQAAPGPYEVDVFLNQRFVRRTLLDFALDAQESLSACLSAALLHEAGIQLTPADVASGDCRPIGLWIAAASARFDSGRLRLDLSVPQSALIPQRSGAVALEELDAGETMAFINYDASAYWSMAGRTRAPELFASLQYGGNLGLWQLRQQASARGAGSQLQWQASRSWLQRPLPQWQSQLVLGDAATPGNLFGSAMLRGVQMATDERMLPDGLRGYAPTVRGIAASNARVTLRQDGNVLYQTTVAPGAFVIDDLYPAGVNSDLQVEVAEADGSSQHYSLPYIALPQSLRPGQHRLAWALGVLPEYGNAPLGQLELQAGISNALSLRGGLRGARDYGAIAGGMVWASTLGALGLDLLLAQGQGSAANWQWSVRWSQRLSGSDTRLGAELTQRHAGCIDFAETQRASRLACAGATRLWSVSGGQTLGRWGQLFVAALSRQSDARRAHEIQASHSVVWAGLAFTAALSRQRHTGGGSEHAPARTSVLLSLAGLWGGVNTGGNLSQHSGSPARMQATLSGSATPRSHYGAVLTQERGGSGALDLNLQTNLPALALGVSAGAGPGYRQAGSSVRGAWVAHAGGVTAGPWLSDTFGIVAAPGARGADVRDGAGAVVDRAGYALIAALQPYRYNEVTLGTLTLDPAIELLSSQQRVAPYAGAAPRLQFKTRHGRAVLLRLTRDDGAALPFGADVYAGDGQLLGLVGQQSQLYARVPAATRELHVRWGDSASAQCQVTLPEPVPGKEAVAQRAVCRMRQAVQP